MTNELEDLMCRHPKVAKAAADGAEPAAASIVLDTEGSAEQILSWLSDPATGVPRYLKQGGSPCWNDSQNRRLRWTATPGMLSRSVGSLTPDVLQSAHQV